MSKTFNVKDIVNVRKNELDYSPLFQSNSESTTKRGEKATRPPEQMEQISQQDASKPENRNAGIPANKHFIMPENQHSRNLAIQHNVTATEKVTYRFHPEAKYAIEDIKTILSRKVGIKASYELIAEEAILIAYEDLLENQHASKLAKRLARKPENKKSS
jgi:hypothetical protein